MATISSSTIETLEFTKDHLKNPKKYAPSANKNDESKKTLIRFTILDSNPICSITQNSFKIGEIIAICTQCLSPFLARVLWRNFQTSKNITCPVCNFNLQKNDLKLPTLERTRVRIDLIKEKIALFEIDLEKSQESLKQLSKTIKTPEKIIKKNIKDKDEDPSDEYAIELKKLDVSFLQASKTSEDNLKQAKESEIKELKAAIQQEKLQLSQLVKLENTITSKKQAEEKQIYYNKLRKNAFIVSVIVLPILVSYKLLLQYNLCSFIY